MTPLMPRSKAPELAVETLDSGAWRLSDQAPENFTLIVFYRGLHCPICARYLGDLDRKIGDFAARGVGVITVSGDERERAAKSKAEWEIENVTIGYAQSIASMREWGLYVSTAIKEAEPAEFGEPGVFLIRPDQEVYYIATSSAPFARPSFRELLGAIDYALEVDYPPRGVA